MIAAVFRAEFLRALPVLPWLLGLHGLTFGLRTCWQDEFSSRLCGVIDWVTCALALIVLVGSLWQDSPARPDRFAAARPVRLSALLSAKILALITLVALPFVVVEWGSLVWWEQPADIVRFGTLQTAMFTVVAVLAAFPIMWFWRDATTGFTGAAVAFVVGAVFLRWWGENPLNVNGPRWIGLNYLMTPPVMFAAIAVAGLLSAVAFAVLPRRGRPLPAIPSFTAIVCLALGTALWLRVREVPSDSAERAALVTLRYTPQQHADGYGTRLDITPPSGPGDPEIERTRSFTKLRANGKNALRWNELRYGFSMNEQFNPGVRAALIQHYGAHLDLLSGPGEPVEPAMANIDEGYPPREPIAYDVQIRESGVRWQVVAELPLVQGAAARHGSSEWTVKELTGYRDGPVLTEKDALLVEQFPKLWLGDVLQPPSRTQWADRFFLIDPAGGQVLWVSSQQMPSLSSGRATLQRRQLRVYLRQRSWSSDEPPKIDWSRDYRLVILRAKEVETRHFDWSSAGPVIFPSRQLEIPFIPSLKSLPPVEPELNTPADAAHLARCGLDQLAEGFLQAEPLSAGLSADEWIAWFRLHPNAKTFRALADVTIPRSTLEQEADAWLAGYQVSLPNPYVDSRLEVALARGTRQAPQWLKEAILGKRKEEPRFSDAWVDRPIREAFAVPDHLKDPEEIVGWFLAQDPSRFAFNLATGKYQLR